MRSVVGISQEIRVETFSEIYKSNAFCLKTTDKQMENACKKLGRF